MRSIAQDHQQPHPSGPALVQPQGLCGLCGHAVCQHLHPPQGRDHRRRPRDLFPKAFIINPAAPSNYVGPARMFGKLTKEGRVGALLPRAASSTTTTWRQRRGGCRPSTRRPTFRSTTAGDDSQSLREAIHSFVLACAVRELRGQGLEHSSMLIHVTRYVSVRDHVREQVEGPYAGCARRSPAATTPTSCSRRCANSGTRTSSPSATRSPSSRRQRSCLRRCPRGRRARRAARRARRHRRALDQRDGQGRARLRHARRRPQRSSRSAATKLARGLTLEGLCTSYFVRTTKMATR